MDYIQYETREEHIFQNKNGKRRRGSSLSDSGSPEIINPIRQRYQANARERDRTHSVNTAFTTLRTLIPTEPKDRKLSKIETLRLASSYISHLGTQLLAGPVDQPCLRLAKQIVNDLSSTTDRFQVCTFCIAHRKTPVVFRKEKERFEKDAFAYGPANRLKEDRFYENSMDTQNFYNHVFHESNAELTNVYL